MLCKCQWIVLYTVHFTAFCLGGPFFPGHGVEYSCNFTALRRSREQAMYKVDIMPCSCLSDWAK